MTGERGEVAIATLPTETLRTFLTTFCSTLFFFFFLYLLDSQYSYTFLVWAGTTGEELTLAR